MTAAVCAAATTVGFHGALLSPSGAPVPASTGAAYTTGEPAVDALQKFLLPTIESNRVSFAGRTGQVLGFGAGAAYPQVWLRDSATVLPLAVYSENRARLVSWLEEHLAHQAPDGALFDWIAAGEASRFRADAPRVREVHRAGGLVTSADRNTTETDQEASAVLAALQLVELTGDRAWLRREVEGRSILWRLDRALASVLERRQPRDRGLITSAFTADWGDVSPAWPDQRAIYVDEKTPVVVGLYTNALFYRAADALAGLHRAAGDTARAAHWESAARDVRQAIDRELWQESRGFYRMHRPVGGPPPGLDDSDVFALGGNALAALYGVADARRAASIFKVAEERRRRLGLATIAGVLLPPFRRGFFLHPALREEYQYQNGGQWDWWAGRWLLAEFERGQAGRAWSQLTAVAARVAASGGLFEWNDREGRGQGSARYAGSAGALGAAVFQGLFGIDFGSDGLRLHVRLGARDGEVRVGQPSSGRRVHYRYRCSRDRRRLELAYEGSLAGSGTLEVLLPEGHTVAQVRRDGRPVSFRLRAVGRDRYVLLETDWAHHVLEVTLRSTGGGPGPGRRASLDPTGGKPPVKAG